MQTANIAGASFTFLSEGDHRFSCSRCNRSFILGSNLRGCPLCAEEVEQMGLNACHLAALRLIAMLPAVDYLLLGLTKASVTKISAFVEARPEFENSRLLTITPHGELLLAALDLDKHAYEGRNDAHEACFRALLDRTRLPETKRT